MRSRFRVCTLHSHGAATFILACSQRAAEEQEQEGARVASVAGLPSRTASHGLPKVAKIAAAGGNNWRGTAARCGCTVHAKKTQIQ
jgi:hypothetical protein